MKNNRKKYLNNCENKNKHNCNLRYSLNQATLGTYYDVNSL